jgi:predicted aspartyl protease
MIEFPFNPQDNLIVVPVEVHGKSQHITLDMAVDTGATWTIMPIKTCSIIGAVYLRNVSIVTGSRVENARLMAIPLIRAFGVDMTNFKVVAHDLPPSLLVDGLLGMNFLKRAKLTIDFHKNIIKIPN